MLAGQSLSSPLPSPILILISDPMTQPHVTIEIAVEYEFLAMLAGHFLPSPLPSPLLIAQPDPTMHFPHVRGEVAGIYDFGAMIAGHFLSLLKFEAILVFCHFFF